MLSLLLLPFLWLAPQETKAVQKPPLPEFNRHVLAVLRSYPTDGTHRYYWPRGKDGRGWGGNARDLHYRGKLVAKGDPKGRGYCCGLTFEVFVQAYERACKARKQPFLIPGVADGKALLRLRGLWFGSDGNRKTLARTIEQEKLGRLIPKFEDVRPGDFVQLWRRSGSGHSVIFLSWLRKKQKIVGLRYWSTQTSTKGIGERVEYFATGPKDKRGVDPKQLYIARVELPKRKPK